jgi:hypothetical protein
VTVLPTATPAEQQALTGGAHATAARSSYAAQGALAGSLLSAQTWKQAFAAATRRQVATDHGSGTGDREAS